MIRARRPPALFEALYPHAEAATRSRTLTVPSRVTGMGELLELEIGRLADPDHVSLWVFDRPRPRLGFEHVSPDASRRARISRLWIVGGAFYFDARGQFHGRGARTAMRVRKLSGAARAQAARSREGRRYRDTHGGHTPREVVRGTADLGQLIPVGWLRAISYQTDKAERAPVDPAPYRHPFEPEARPIVCATSSGRALVVLSDKDLGAVRYEDPRTGATFSASRFGRYTVTPHGIEDIE